MVQNIEKNYLFLVVLGGRAKKANIEIIKLDTPDTVAITSHIYTEHKHFFPLIRVKSIDGYVSKWYTNDSSLNTYTQLEKSTLSAGQNEFSNVSELLN